MEHHRHPVQIYYEDTDLSGVVYHANYLKFFERAREHLIGPTELARLYNEDGIGFVVYKCELTFKQGARLGDLLEIRTRVEQTSPYRAIFHQEVWKEGVDKPYVVGEVQLVCVDEAQNMVRMPELNLAVG
jgi:tol-pal system-associated acyl-CoA thioesterase